MARRGIDTTNEYLGKADEFNISEIGDGPLNIEVVDKVLTCDKAEQEAFMNEMVTIMVHDSTDENAEPLIPVGINGRMQYFARGVPQRVRRCYVERLARAKKTSYSQNLDERLGEALYNTMRPHHALKYPFSVVEDPNPKGAAWLRNLLAERG